MVVQQAVMIGLPVIAIFVKNKSAPVSPTMQSAMISHLSACTVWIVVIINIKKEAGYAKINGVMFNLIGVNPMHCIRTGFL